ncbi:amine oxidase [copper-containing], partial [Biomphalaria pfeifferi]
RMWLSFSYSVPFFSLHPVDFGILVNFDSVDPYLWYIEQLWYAGQRFHSVGQFVYQYKDKAMSPEICRVSPCLHRAMPPEICIDSPCLHRAMSPEICIDSPCLHRAMSPEICIDSPCLHRAMSPEIFLVSPCLHRAVPGDIY